MFEASTTRILHERCSFPLPRHRPVALAVIVVATCTSPSFAQAIGKPNAGVLDKLQTFEMHKIHITKPVAAG
ncbi:hypothetical protein HJB61_22095 [Rhizobium lentis]|nr:hypothetical protein [Rhizobium lentis]